MRLRLLGPRFLIQSSMLTTHLRTSFQLPWQQTVESSGSGCLVALTCFIFVEIVLIKHSWSYGSGSLGRVYLFLRNFLINTQLKVMAAALWAAFTSFFDKHFDQHTTQLKVMAAALWAAFTSFFWQTFWQHTTQLKVMAAALWAAFTCCFEKLFDQHTVEKLWQRLFGPRLLIFEKLFDQHTVESYGSGSLGRVYCFLRNFLINTQLKVMAAALWAAFTLFFWQTFWSTHSWKVMAAALWAAFTWFFEKLFDQRTVERCWKLIKK